MGVFMFIGVVVLLLTGCSSTINRFQGKHSKANAPTLGEKLNYSRGFKGKQYSFRAEVMPGTGQQDKQLTYRWDFSEIGEPQISTAATPSVTITEVNSSAVIRLKVWAGSGDEQSEPATQDYLFECKDPAASAAPAVVQQVIPPSMLASGNPADFRAELFVSQALRASGFKYRWSFGEGAEPDQVDGTARASGLEIQELLAAVTLTGATDDPVEGKLQVFAHDAESNALPLTEETFNFSIAPLAAELATAQGRAGEDIELSYSIASGTVTQQLWELNGALKAQNNLTAERLRVSLPEDMVPGVYDLNKLTIANPFDTQSLNFSITVLPASED